MTPTFWFVAFTLGVLFLLALDLFVFHRRAHAVSLKEASAWSIFWVSLSLIFAAVVWNVKGRTSGIEFLTGYLIEYSLSMDNIFIFVLIFSYFKVRPEHQHRVLFWGIMGALVMRGIMIAIGVAMVTRFEWLLYVFGAFLLFTGIKMLFSGDEEMQLEDNPLLKFCRKWLPISPSYDGEKFTVNIDGKRMLTPLALVLILIEAMDLVFAVDSIPAIFAVTRDPFVVYSSNICAILGLRSMYFVLAHGVTKMAYLRYGLAGVLTFIGIKMIISKWFHMPVLVSLGVVGTMLGAAVLASIIWPPKPKQPNDR